MPEEEEVYSTKMKHDGVFLFKDFYQFCYDWLVEETDLKLIEEKYEEKITGDSKYILIVWVGKRKVTDYFRYKVKITFRLIGLKEVEVMIGNVKTKANKGSVEIKVKGTLVRDWQGKFERDGYRKFLRGIYEKWVIPARIEEYEDKLVDKCDEFLNQAKAWLDLEGKR